MIKSVTFKKFLAILLSVLMVFGFAAASVQSVYAAPYSTGVIFYAENSGSPNFTVHDQALFLSAFTRSCYDLPHIPFEAVSKASGKEIDYGVHPDYNYYFQNSLGDYDPDRIDIICGNNPDFARMYRRYLAILDKLYTHVLGLRSKSEIENVDEFIEELTKSIFLSDVMDVVNTVYDTAFLDTVYDAKMNPADYIDIEVGDCKWSVDKFAEETMTIREEYAKNICGKLIYSYYNLLPDEEVSGYGSIFSQGSSIAMLAVAAAEAAVIVALLAKNKKLKQQPAAK